MARGEYSGRQCLLGAVGVDFAFEGSSLEEQGDSLGDGVVTTPWS